MELTGDDAPFPSPVVASAIRIMQTLAGDSPQAGVSELARSLGIQKSSCLNILRTLVRFNVVMRVPGGTKYQLGPKLAELGAASRRNFSYRETLRRHFEGLVAGSRMMCLFAQALGNESSFVIIDHIVAPGVQRSFPLAGVGTVLPLTDSATGCAILSSLDEEDAMTIVRHNGALSKKVGVGVWRDRMREIRARGYAVSREDYKTGVNAVAVPIHRAGETYLAVTLIGLVEDMPTASLDKWGKKLSKAAEDFQENLTVSSRN